MDDKRDEEWLQNELAVRAAFVGVFQNGDGPTVLAIIGNQLGAFAVDANQVDPKLIAHWHWLLAQIGIIHPMNMLNATTALLGAANNSDLTAIRETAAKK